MKSPAQITFNADDLGMGDDIDKGIFHAMERGLIHSTSASVVNGVTPETLSRFANIAGPNSLGLHINLTEGVPAGHSRLFTKSDGRFRDAINLLADQTLLEDILYSEMAAQLDRFVKMAGMQPSHIDSHQHFAYLHPAAFAAFLRLAEQARIKIRSPLPFISPVRLKDFVVSTEERFKVQIPFAPEERAQELNEIFRKCEVTLRTTDCFLEFPMKEVARDKTEEGLTIEVVCHPRYGASGFAEAAELAKAQEP